MSIGQKGYRGGRREGGGVRVFKVRSNDSRGDEDGRLIAVLKI